MSELSGVAGNAFASEYRNRAGEVHKWVGPLSEEQFWRNPFSYGNSAGHLILHLTGNLSYYIGAQIAGTGYIRHRDLEFSESRKPTKAEVMQKFDETIALVIATIEKQREADWTAPYSAEREPDATNRFTLFLRCASHLYHHVGQIIYLSRELRRT
ncbi:MAG TPA: DinB family protein [Candidatus Acidoferrum sp.]|nr:DinB family protein [Candidatus Acidoferrum sp.]